MNARWAAEPDGSRDPAGFSASLPAIAGGSAGRRAGLTGNTGKELSIGSIPAQQSGTE
ncbi:hypothetical protein [Aromatoleum aromaticum]|uniref:hypothetical protein n=1 Tax=Aromatoleum aromaticum TaxID=551760 RepID=UPI001459E74D|nr:hypothetical protein [Aromatoleum aromaticum]NMG55670.1 hypothetical protein [Aromatoleum aromaticum]